MAEASLTFLPWIRYGISSIIPEGNGGGSSAAGGGEVRRYLDIRASIVGENGNGYSITKKVILKGPGEILGFNPAMVARTEPVNGDNDFEPNYFPFVEFTEADFPWRYSIDSRHGEKVTPWISLVVLKRGMEFEELSGSECGVPLIRVKEANVLPDLGDSWAWAHVQLSAVITDEAGNEIDPSQAERYEEKVRELALNQPGLICSRLLCPRKLVENTLYSAFIVPTYNMGKQAALGLDVEDTADFAWSTGEKDVVLPYYYRWDFQTSEDGDFEELLDRLRIIENAPEGTGIKEIDASNTGYPAAGCTGNFYQEGVLVPLDYVKDTSPNVSFSTNFIEILNQSLYDPQQVDLEGEDPLVTIPVYGRYQNKKQKLQPPQSDGTWRNDWASELNLDRGYRLGAAMGVRAVQENEEEFAKECWEQAGALREANELLRTCAAARYLSGSLVSRHILPLSDYRFLSVTERYHSHVMYDSNPEGKISLRSRVKDCGIPPGVFSSPFRKLASRKIGYRNIKDDEVFSPWKENNGTELERGEDEDATFYCLLSQAFMRVLMEDDYDQGSYRKYIENWKGYTGRILKPEVVVGRPFLISAGDSGGEEPTAGQKPVKAYFNEKEGLLKTLNSMIKLPGARINNFNPVLWGPKLDHAMYRYLMKQSVDNLVPGIDRLEPNSVLVLQQNSKFIEAYMVGLNHEISRELTWREFTFDRRCTVFNYFWDPVWLDDNPQKDIKDIHEWSHPLGANSGRSTVSSKNGNIVLVIKADLFRRYPQTILFAMKIEKAASGSEDERLEAVFNKLSEGGRPDANGIVSGTATLASNGGLCGFTAYNPAFYANVGEDMMFACFPFSKNEMMADKSRYAYYFVIMEHSSLIRLGLNSTKSGSLQGNDELSWQDVSLKDGSQWLDMASVPQVADSAAFAGEAYQMPVRIVLDAESLIKL